MKKNAQFLCFTIWLLTIAATARLWGQQQPPPKNPNGSSLPAYEGELKDPTRAELDGEFKKRTEQQVLRLQECIQIISDKNQSSEKREIAIKEVIKLFQPAQQFRYLPAKKGDRL